MVLEAAVCISSESFSFFIRVFFFFFLEGGGWGCIPFP